MTVFVGLPTNMTNYGQGTLKDGFLYGLAKGYKSLYPIKDDVPILGAYFNGNWINMMQEFSIPLS